MKKASIYLFAALSTSLFLFSSCSDDDTDIAPETITVRDTIIVTETITETITITETDTVTVTETVTETVTIDSSVPTGTTTVSRSGNFTPENSQPTAGSASIITDEDGEYFLVLSENFTTQQGTGTVSIFLAQSATFSNDPSLSSQKVVGAINKDGAAYFKLAGEPAAEYTHIILWCSTAGISFGNAELK